MDVYVNLPDAADHPGGHPGIFHNSGWPVELLEVKPFKAAKPAK